jgi:hypothetical protein
MIGSTYDPATDAWTVDDSPSASYAQALDTIAPNITGIVQQNKVQDESWTDALIRLLPAVAATWQQKQLLQVQVERAKQGLPPLDANQIAAGVNVGLSSDTQKLVMWGGAALLVTIVIMSLSARRRR